MNILFSSDDNYARHLGVAIYSLLSHNTSIPQIRIYVIDNNISPDNIKKLNQVISSFRNAEMILIPFKKWADSLHLNMMWPISLSSYARLFVDDMLPLDVDRVLYMDCDMLVRGEISELWHIDLGDNIIGAVQDQVSETAKTRIGLNFSDQYFNAGLLLIDLKKWRQARIGDKCVRFIEAHDGQVMHHDQGVLNGVLKNQWVRLPLKYNVMTIHFMMSQKRIIRFFHEKSSFYSIDEIDEAKHRPVILHFTPSFTSHPWERDCKHPMRNLYIDAQKHTPWSGFPLEKSNSPWYVKLINYYYRNFPIF